MPDLILLDINMPHMDGLEFCEKIRDKISCPILFLTARVEEQDKINGFLSGGDDYIIKPFSLKELEARIIAHLKREERSKRKSRMKYQNGLMIDYVAKDVNIVYEVFENLLANAIRFAEKVISIELQSENGRLMLMVRDDGSGFAGNEGEIGEAFYRSGLSDDLKHFGLRLYLCNMYCSKHGGKLLVGNAYGGGACVKAYFESRK